jgi:hypothetical protein
LTRHPAACRVAPSDKWGRARKSRRPRGTGLSEPRPDAPGTIRRPLRGPFYIEEASMAVKEAEPTPVDREIVENLKEAVEKLVEAHARRELKWRNGPNPDPSVSGRAEPVMS